MYKRQVLYYDNDAKISTTTYGINAQGTGALKIPVGTTVQRPTGSSLATGQIRWNSTDGAIEVYNGSAWTAVGTGSSNKVLNTFTGDGSTTTFTLTVTPANEDALMVFIDGAYQEAGDYVLTNNSLALDTAPLSGEKVSAHITTASVHDGTSAVNQQFTGDGSTTAFTLSSAPGSENNTQIYINGVYQQKTDYTVSGTTLTFDTAPTSGDIIEVNMFTVTTLGNSDTVTEGVSNLYHTTARAISAISDSTLTGNLTLKTSVDNSLAQGLAIERSANSDKGYINYNGGAFQMRSTIGDPIAFGETDAEHMRIAPDGDVGIGTSSPQTRLHVDSSDGSGIRISRSASATAYMQLFPAYSNVPTIMGLGAGGLHLGYNSNTAGIRIDTSNNVAIGTTSVLSGNKLDVRGGNIMVGGYGGGTDYGLILTPDDGSGYWNVANISGGHLTFNNSSTIGSSEKMRIDGSGNVGIGNASPAQKLDVSGHIKLTGSGTYLFGGDNEILAGQDSGGYYFATGNSQDVNKAVYIGDNASSVRFGVGNAVRMQIEQGGQIKYPNQTRFSAYSNSGNTAYSTAGTAFVLNLVRDNVNSGYNTSTGIFTADVTGYYTFRFNAYTYVGGQWAVLYYDGSSLSYYVDTNGTTGGSDHTVLQTVVASTINHMSWSMHLDAGKGCAVGWRSGYSGNIYRGHAQFSGELVSAD
mgnify:FL=1